jgi:hypothetical protein
MAEKIYQLPNGKKYSLDLDNPEHASWLEEAAKEMPENSVGRQVGLTARAAVKGAATVPGMMADAVTGIYNTAADTLGIGSFRFPQTQVALDRLLSAVGLPEPQGKLENVVAKGLEGGLGALTFGGIAKNAPAGLSALGEKLGSQAVAASSGAMGAETAKQQDLPWYGQAAAGLFAGMSPQILTGGAQAFGRGVKHLTEPWMEGGTDAIKGRLLTDLAGGNKQAVIEALKNTSDDLPGGYSTAGFKAAQTGNAEIPAVEKLVTNKFAPTRADEILRQNEAARVATVQKTGKDQTALAEALRNRKTQADLDYGKAFKRYVADSPELQAILENPYVKQAMPDVLDLVKSRGLDLNKDRTEVLHLVKRGLDKMMQANASKPLVAEEKREIVRVQQELMGWLGKKNSAYTAAKTNFEEASKPITQMRVGQFLEDKLTTPLETSQRPAVFAGALRNAPQTIKQAGGGQANSLEEILTPEQLFSMDSVYTNLKQASLAEQLARKGMTSAREKLGNAFEPIEPPGMLSRPIMIARAILERVQGHASEKTLKELAFDMQDPAKIARLLENAKPEEKIAFMLALKQQAAAQAQVLPNIQGER